MISIIIPLYNKKDSIIRTLTSILKQTGVDFEVVVVDDGSTDGSGELVKSLDNRLIRYYRKENGGVSSARNYGFQKARGEWIFFLDADDTLLQGSLETLYVMSQQYTNAKILVGHTQWIQNGREIQCVNRGENHVWYSRNPYFGIWFNKFYPHPGSMLIHRSLIEERGCFNEKLTYFEDYDFTLRILKGTNVAYTNKAVMCYFQNEGGLSTSKHKPEKEMSFYIPQYINNCSFWHKALLYENIEFCLLSYEDQSPMKCYYKEMQRHYFGLIHSILHSIRQRLINYKLI